MQILVLGKSEKCLVSIRRYVLYAYKNKYHNDCFYYGRLEFSYLVS